MPNSSNNMGEKTGQLKRRREQAVDHSLQKSQKTEPAEQSGDRVQTEPARKRARVDAHRSLFVRSLPPSATDESLTDFFSQHYPVKHATVVKDPTSGENRGYGFVTFTDADDAREAKEKLHGQKLDGRKINIEVAEARERKPSSGDPNAISKKEQRKTALEESRRPPKLIVRNLPWSIKTDKQLSALFHSFGKVKFADLPQSKGKLAGFGFVTIRGKPNAQKALDTLNGKIIDGRELAVDWAIEKQDWAKRQEHEAPVDPEQPDDAGVEPLEDSEADEKKDDEEDEEEDEDLRNFMKKYGDNLEDEEDDEEKPENDEEEDAAPEDEIDTAPTRPLVSNNSTTVFLRNLPFSTTDDELKTFFSESFGPVRYARVVLDRANNRPAGTGFVCFATEADYSACLRGAPRPRPSDASGKRSILQDETADSKYMLQGRVLQVSQAVSKDEATRLATNGVAVRDGKDKDKRRLYLLSEGTIPNGSALYSLLAPTEVKMREDSAVQRKKQIQGNPSLHISLTRLAVRNIPRGITSKDLKALAREAVVGFAKDVKEGRREPLSKEENSRGGDEDKEAERKRKEKGKGIVKQAKIVFENREGSKVGEGDGAGRSRGYGFIEYSSHRSALMGLRWLNGHALKNAVEKTQRLIVEFAIENAQVVARRNDMQVRFGNRGREQNAAGPHKPRLSNDRGGFNESRTNKKFPVPKANVSAKKGTAANEALAGNGGDESKSAARQALDQKIIGRKRVMRKKKANVRRG